MNAPIDAFIRKRAINPHESFIIQAPAGSGKTELLTQRYLNLLAHAVKNPEEIIAITFTRKASNEMRKRIIAALEFANTEAEPKESYKATTWWLANAVLKADAKYSWHLLENPNRLRILTIDALCTWLNAQIPLLSGFGAKAEIQENTEALYKEATTTLIENPTPCKEALNTLLLHVDNNADKLSTLLVTLLQKREQWLPHIMQFYRDTDSCKSMLEAGLANIVSEILQNADKIVPESDKASIAELCRFAANELASTNPSHLIRHGATMSQFPAASIQFLQQWKVITEIFLTTENKLRRKVDKRLGFPSEKKLQKSKLQALLQSYQENDELIQALVDIKLAPPITYTDKQWCIINALLEILPLLCAHLNLLFRKNESTDFVEVTLRALQALGDEEFPTDIAMYLDYQIKHLLIDEFQDTSVMQFNLIEKLVLPWQPSDGKSLFLVGDPMQSIYRFRNAEVGLFIRAQRQGINNIQLHPLKLSVNFRSDFSIIEWINSTFKNIFPQKAVIHSGAVSYTKSISGTCKNDDAKICYYATNKKDVSSLIECIKNLQAKNSNDTIAILVKSRTHLTELIPALKKAQLPYEAIELETLVHRPEIIDLVSLTRALSHLGDRLAWLSLLRTPWCGLTLHDLHTISRFETVKPLWSALLQYQKIESLSDEGKTRLAHILPILMHSLQQENKITLTNRIKGTWLALNGPACLQSRESHSSVNRYFELLEELQHDFNLERLIEKLSSLYAKPNQTEKTTIQIMTIHKSKGLEFDHVILPELQRQPPSDSDELFMWHLAPNQHSSEDLIFAPIKSSEEPYDEIHRYLKLLEKKKLQYETARVFYVAVTRAKKSLHLHVSIDIDDEDKIISPSKNSFAYLLWKQHQNEFIKAYKTNNDINSQIVNQLQLRRITTDWFTAQKTSTFPKENATENLNQAKKITPSGQQAAHLGSIIHEVLQVLALGEISHDKKQLKDNYLGFWKRRLIQLGATNNALVQLVLTAIENTLDDPRGQWILHSHQDAHSEFEITTMTDNKFQQLIIDRTFIDNNIRWIIDFKTSSPHNESLNTFLENQIEIYRPQLNNYAKAMHALDPRPIRLGLYFPLCSAWTEWSFIPNSEKVNDALNHSQAPLHYLHSWLAK